jgi:hypothetical protein
VHARSEVTIPADGLQLEGNLAVPDRVAAVVSRGGRPDLAGDALTRLKAPTLLIVGGADATVLKESDGRRPPVR